MESQPRWERKTGLRPGMTLENQHWVLWEIDHRISRLWSVLEPIPHRIHHRNPFIPIQKQRLDSVWHSGSISRIFIDWSVLWKNSSVFPLCGDLQARIFHRIHDQKIMCSREIKCTDISLTYSALKTAIGIPGLQPFWVKDDVFSMGFCPTKNTTEISTPLWKENRPSAGDKLHPTNLLQMKREYKNAL